MKHHLSDDKMDTLLRSIVADAAADEAAVDEIADSPKLWWAVQREIAREKELQPSHSPWPPVQKLRRWLLIGMPVAAVLLLTAMFFLRASSVKPDVANQTAPANVTTPAPSNDLTVSTPSVPSISVIAEHKVKVEGGRTTYAKASVQKRDHARQPSVSTSVAAKTEIKTDFIALSYAGNPESGQLVRVKVPSSMMVSLGLVSHVENPKNLVDAEVVVGDDGLTRAIRFIR
jgi:hypothetical protein